MPIAMEPSPSHVTERTEVDQPVEEAPVAMPEVREGGKVAELTEALAHGKDKTTRVSPPGLGSRGTDTYCRATPTPDPYAGRR